MSIFKELITRKPPQLLWQGQLFFSLLDGFPATPGHALVIPTREVKGVLELNEEEWVELKKCHSQNY